MRRVPCLSLITPLIAAASCLASQPAASRPSGAPVVTVLEAGASPRQTLRLAPRVGARQAFDLTMHEASIQTLGEQVFPEITPARTFSIEARVSGIDGAHDISYAYECTNIIVHDTPDIPPHVLESMRADMRSLVGLRGTGVLSPLAVSKRTAVTAPAGMNPLHQGQLEGLRELLARITTPFPAEPVGVGGSWRVERAIDEGTITIYETIVYTLTATDGNTIELDVDIAQAADPQAVTTPGLSPGTTARLVLLKSQGHGRVALKLDEVLPFKVTRQIVNDTSIVYKIIDVEQEVKHHVEMTMELKTTTRAK